MKGRYLTQLKDLTCAVFTLEEEDHNHAHRVTWWALNQVAVVLTQVCVGTCPTYKNRLKTYYYLLWHDVPFTIQ